MAKEQKSGRRLILADGTTFENADAGYADGTLGLYLHGRTMMEVLPVVTDSAKIAEITYEFGEDSITYTGYTEVTAILNREAECYVGLRKAVV